MSLLNRSTVLATLIFISGPASEYARAQDLPMPPVPQRLAHRSAVVERPTHVPDPSPAPSAPASEADDQPPAYVVPSDPYGFAQILNAYRASAGLPPVAYDPNLSAWASRNNAVQCRRGIGHHVNPGCFQNCGWNYASAWDVARGWLHSPGHRDNMLQPSITRFGIAYGPGPYWTLNAR